MYVYSFAPLLKSFGERQVMDFARLTSVLPIKHLAGGAGMVVLARYQDQDQVARLLR